MKKEKTNKITNKTKYGFFVKKTMKQWKRILGTAIILNVISCVLLYSTIKFNDNFGDFFDNVKHPMISIDCQMLQSKIQSNPRVANMAINPEEHKNGGIISPSKAKPKDCRMMLKRIRNTEKMINGE